MKNPNIYDTHTDTNMHITPKLFEIQFGLHTCESLLLAKCSTLVDNDDIFVVVFVRRTN